MVKLTFTIKLAQNKQKLMKSTKRKCWKNVPLKSS